jgi:thiamine phosphate synthase YjbQ (UPF0047 family)
MPVKSLSMQVKMQGDCRVENITGQVQAALAHTQLRAGILTILSNTRPLPC